MDFWIMLGIILLLSIQPAAAQQGTSTSQRDQVTEQEILDRLAKINPQAVPVFQQATQALDAGQFQAALEGYQQVLKLAPNFPDALRRLSSAALDLQDVEGAIQYAQDALTAQFSPLNQATLARALLSRGSAEDNTQALELSQEAYSASPDDPYIVQVFLWAGVALNEGGVIRQASAGMLRLSPNHPAGHYFAGLVAIEDKKWELAERELLKSQELGISADTVQKIMSDYQVSSKARASRWTRRAEYGLAGLAVLTLLFLLARFILKRMRLAKVSENQPDLE